MKKIAEWIPEYKDCNHYSRLRNFCKSIYRDSLPSAVNSEAVLYHCLVNIPL